jgi:carbon monoxide dehydrogenase subunit G
VTQIATSIERSRHIQAEQHDVWEVISDPEQFGRLVPDVETHEPVDDGWRWVLEPTRRMGVTIQPHFTVRYELDPPTLLTFERVRREGETTGAGGACELYDDGASTQVTFRLDIEIQVGVPSLLSGTVRAILDEEISRLADGFLKNLDNAVTTGGA